MMDYKIQCSIMTTGMVILLAKYTSEEAEMYIFQFNIVKDRGREPSRTCVSIITVYAQFSQVTIEIFRTSLSSLTTYYLYKFLRTK